MVRRFSALRLVAIALLILVSTPLPAGAAPATVHDISTCAALNTHGANASFAADTINLTADLNCTGVTFLPMFTGGFSGTLEGNGHSIANLTINRPSNSDVGLFSYVNSGTVRNLTLASGSVTGRNHTGALMGRADHVTVSSVTSAVNTSSESDAGGLIGFMASGSGGSLIEDVSTTGAVAATGTFMDPGLAAGGLVGYLIAGNAQTTIRRSSHTSGAISAEYGEMGGLVGSLHINGIAQPSGLIVEDSYSTGVVGNSANYNVGGLIGMVNINANGSTAALDLMRVYSTASVHGDYNVGGLLGIGAAHNSGATIVITDSFAVGAVTGNTNTGGIVGRNVVALPQVMESAGNYYDGPGTGQTVCATDVALSGTCTRIDTGATPNYFKGNRANAPFTNWDFAGTWRTNAGAYPTFIPLDDGDSVDKADEAAGPGDGDANGDGTADAAQPDVVSFPNPVTGEYAVLETSCGSLTSAQVGAESTTAGQTDVAYSYPGGLIQFVATGCTPGATVTITQTFFGLNPSAQYTLRKANAGVYTTVPGATFTATTIGGELALQAVYQVTDGSALDDDGLTDGNIVDPAGPAVLGLSVPNTGLGGTTR